MRAERDEKGNKFAATYRKSIWIVHNGRDYLEAVYDRPATLRRQLATMRQMNPNRVYVTDDPINP